MSFASGLEAFGDHPALICDSGVTLSYRGLARAADEMFSAAGAPRKRSIVAIECANTAPSVCAYLGALRAGMPALLLDQDLDPALKDRLYAHYGIAWSCTADGTWRQRSAPASEPHPDVALLLSTSGSTGAQKLVKLTLSNLQSNALSIARYLSLDESERPITALPVHYSFGLSVLNSHLAVGATLLLTHEPVTARGFWNHFRNHAATSFSGVPATYAFLRQMRFERMSLPSLRTLTQAGGRLAPEQVEWFAAQATAHARRFFVMYGQTEAAPRMAYVPPESLPAKAGSIGIAIPGGTLELIGDNGQLITASKVTGELRYCGPNVMMGYATDRDSLAAPDECHGVLCTGDLAWRDEDGFYYLVGRRNRFIKVFGNRIALDEVEMQLQSAGHDVAVTGEDDRLLVAARGAADADALMRLVSSRYRLHPSAVTVVRVDDFPRAPSGKVRYAALLAQVSR